MKSSTEKYMSIKFKKFHNILKHMKTFGVTIYHILIHFIGSKLLLYVSFRIPLYHHGEGIATSVLFCQSRSTVPHFADTLTAWLRFPVFQQVQCSPVAAGLRGELQFCHQWGEEKFSPVPALVPLPQWSRRQLWRWVRWVLARRMKKMVWWDQNN